MKRLILLFTLFICINAWSQVNIDSKEYLDSISNVLIKEDTEDTIRLDIKLSLASLLYKTNPDTLFILSKEVINEVDILLKKDLKPREIIKLKLCKSGALNNIGNAYHNIGKDFAALENLFESERILSQIEPIGFGMASITNNIGSVYNKQGNVKEALNYYYKSLKMLEKLDSKRNLSLAYLNIGSVYKDQGDIIMAEKSYLSALKLQDEIDFVYGKGISLNNLGVLYEEKGELKNALSYFNQSLDIRKEIGNKHGVAQSYLNIGGVYQKMLETQMTDKTYNSNKKSLGEKAVGYYIDGANLFQEINELDWVGKCYKSMSEIYFDMNNLTSSLKYGNKALQIARELKYPKDISGAAKVLFKIHEKNKDYNNALVMYKLHIQMRDSVKNEETQKATIRQQTQYEFEKEQIKKEHEAKEQERILEEETTRRNNMQYSIIFLGILLLFGVILSLGFIKVSNNVAEGLIFFAFLIMFEFILVFVEPYLEQYTQGEPMYNLLANAIIALFIFPLHDKLEDLLKKRIVKK